MIKKLDITFLLLSTERQSCNLAKFPRILVTNKNDHNKKNFILNEYECHGWEQHYESKVLYTHTPDISLFPLEFHRVIYFIFATFFLQYYLSAFF